MSKLRAMKKSLDKNTLHFPVEMYNNTLGSLIITYYILAPENEKTPMSQIRKNWKKLRKNGCDFWIDDEHFLDKAADLFKLPIPYDNFAMVQSDLNVLFAPYIDGEILPLREDGFMGITLKSGRIFPVISTNKEEELH